MRKIIATGLVMLATALLWALPSTRTGTVLASWNYTFGDTNNPVNASVTNFLVYFGTISGSYTGSVNAGTNLSVQIPNLVRGSTYFFAATAQSTNGLESDYSVETSVFIPNKPSKPSSPSSALQ